VRIQKLSRLKGGRREERTRRVRRFYRKKERIGRKEENVSSLDRENRQGLENWFGSLPVFCNGGGI
jgi:hypothetical protein